MKPAPTHLFVTWQDQLTRRIVPVGRLLQAGDHYEFAYIRAVEEATALGFEPLLSFPRLDAVYRSQELPPLLSNRLMRPTRADFPQFVEQLGLAATEAEPFTVLARSGGRRATDRLEVFAPPKVAGRRAEGLLLARGVRHVVGAEEAIAQLSPGDVLTMQREPTNPVSVWALLLQDRTSRQVGYTPDYLARELDDLQVSADEVDVAVVKVNLAPAPIHHRLLCRYSCASDLGERMFGGERYRPISSSATNLAA